MPGYGEIIHLSMPGLTLGKIRMKEKGERAPLRLRQCLHLHTPNHPHPQHCGSVMHHWAGERQKYLELESLAVSCMLSF